MKPAASCRPAPYGRACAGCSRAKCKCFYRAEGSDCERCHRLGKPCEQTTSLRKRKADTPPSPPPRAAPNPPNNRLEDKIDHIVSLLSSRAVPSQSPPKEDNTNTPSTTGTFFGSVDVNMPIKVPQEPRDPDVVIDTSGSVVTFVRPASPPSSTSTPPTLQDVSAHYVPEETAEEQLHLFRREFLTKFPFVHLPVTMTAYELRSQKPFLWLVIMSLTTKLYAQQFAMEKTIYKIISQRILCEHRADMDLLLGLVCFGSWFHFFKEDKPFMTTISQLAVSLAFDLDLHHDPASQRDKFIRLLGQTTDRRVGTMEERRTILAVFHLTSSTWTAYRKTEPVRWTPYMDVCLSIMSEQGESNLDMLLALQVKCQIITNQLTNSGVDEPMGGPSTVLLTALLAQLNDIRRNLPTQIQNQVTAQLYLYDAELTIHDNLVNRACFSPSANKRHQSNILSQSRRLQDLDATLTTAEKWLAVMREIPASSWQGVDAGYSTQLSHNVVVLFKLTMLGAMSSSSSSSSSLGWLSPNEVRARVDIFEVMDYAAEMSDTVATVAELVDNDEGPRSGLWFKAKYLMRAIKALFMAEMRRQIPEAIERVGFGAFLSPPTTAGTTTTASEFHGLSSSTEVYSDMSVLDAFAADAEFPVAEDFILGLSQEPWLADIIGSSWDFDPGASLDFDFAT